MYMNTGTRIKNAVTIYALGGLDIRGGTYNPLVSCTAPSRHAYMLAGILGAPIYFILFGWTTPSGPTYMSAGTHSAHMIIPGPKHYMQLQDIISAKIGWNAICGHLTHMKICL